MTKRDLTRLRAALLAGVNAVFDVLEASQVERVQIRPPSKPDGEYTELDQEARRGDREKARNRMSNDRRANGQGTVGQLPSGRWRFRVKKAERADTRAARSTPRPKRTAPGARSWRVRRVVDGDGCSRASPRSRTWMRRWLDERERDGLRGVRSERSAFECRIAPHVIASASAQEHHALDGARVDRRAARVDREAPDSQAAP
jgi:hypothetical protein